MAMLERIVPNAVIPGFVSPIFQEIPYNELLAEVTAFGKPGVDFLYQTTLTRINTPTSVGQQWRSPQDSQSYSLSQLSWPVYTIIAKQEFDPNEAAKFELLGPGIGLSTFLDDLCQQGIWQRVHLACLYGFDTTAEQGIVLNGAWLENLPADSHGKAKLTEYDPTELVQYLASIAREIMNTTYGSAKPVVIASTVEALNYLRTLIVPLVNSQQVGGGVDSALGLYGRLIGEWLGVGKIIMIADNALAGMGALGTDLMCFVAPGLSEQESQKQADQDTNRVANSLPQNKRNTFMDKAGGLTALQNPVIDGISSKLWKYSTTSGSVIRPEAVRTLEFVYA